MKTTAITTLLLVLGLALAGCTIQPAVPVTEETGATTTVTDTVGAPDVEETAIVTGTQTTGDAADDAAADDTATDDVGAVTETQTLTDGAVVTTTSSVLTTTVTTVTQGAVVSETDVMTGVEGAEGDAGAADDAALLPTPTPAAAPAAGDAVTATGAVTAAGAITATTVTTDADAGAILDIISSTPGLESLATALTASGMAAALDTPGPVTFFAPNNDAFAAIPADQMNALLADPATLAPILQYHIVIDNVSTTGLGTLGAALSSSGLPITVTVQADGPLLINDAAIVQGDIAAANGVIHIIDGILLPPATTP